MALVRFPCPCPLYMKVHQEWLFNLGNASYYRRQIHHGLRRHTLKYGSPVTKEDVEMYLPRKIRAPSDQHDVLLKVFADFHTPENSVLSFRRLHHIVTDPPLSSHLLGHPLVSVAFGSRGCDSCGSAYLLLSSSAIQSLSSGTSPSLEVAASIR